MDWIIDNVLFLASLFVLQFFDFFRNVDVLGIPFFRKLIKDDEGLDFGVDLIIIQGLILNIVELQDSWHTSGDAVSLWHELKAGDRLDDARLANRLATDDADTR